MSRIQDRRNMGDMLEKFDIPNSSPDQAAGSMDGKQRRRLSDPYEEERKNKGGRTGPKHDIASYTEEMICEILRKNVEQSSGRDKRSTNQKNRQTTDQNLLQNITNLD